MKLLHHSYSTNGVRPSGLSLRWFLLVAAMSSCPFIGCAEAPINPSNSFYLPAAEVPKMESAALHAGNREAAVR